jgi:hypothetical protein
MFSEFVEIGNTFTFFCKKVEDLQMRKKINWIQKIFPQSPGNKILKTM